MPCVTGVLQADRAASATSGHARRSASEQQPPTGRDNPGVQAGARGGSSDSSTGGLAKPVRHLPTRAGHPGESLCRKVAAHGTGHRTADARNPRRALVAQDLTRNLTLCQNGRGDQNINQIPQSQALIWITLKKQVYQGVQHHIGGSQNA